jgi:type IV secretory pathway ATPase VirB11/archaellum biosynthesis ATPase
MSNKPPILTNSDGVPFDVYYHGGDHAVVIGKIAKGKTFATNHHHLLAEAKNSRIVSVEDAPEITLKKQNNTE